MLLADLPSYVEAQDRVDEVYADPVTWDTKAVLNVARAGRFSADRAIREYAREIWKTRPCPVDGRGEPA
jgi:starch phosphorylase